MGCSTIQAVMLGMWLFETLSLLQPLSLRERHEINGLMLVHDAPDL